VRAALTRGLLLAPDRISRAAAGRAGKPEEAWLLRQPRAVRRSYVEHVLDRGDDERLAEVWMLRQPKAVRDSYIRDVLTDV
jgi:hypothetical protein